MLASNQIFLKCENKTRRKIFHLFFSLLTFTLIRLCSRANVSYAESALDFEKPATGHIFVYLAIEGLVFIVLTILMEVCIYHHLAKNYDIVFSVTFYTYSVLSFFRIFYAYCLASSVINQVHEV